MSKDEMLLKLVHNVNAEVEQLVYDIEKTEIGALEAIKRLRGIQRNHLNYADRKELEESLKEYILKELTKWVNF